MPTEVTQLLGYSCTYASTLRTILKNARQVANAEVEVLTGAQSRGRQPRVDNPLPPCPRERRRLRLRLLRLGFGCITVSEIEAPSVFVNLI